MGPVLQSRGGQPVSIGPMPYQKKWYLLSPAEWDFVLITLTPVTSIW